MIRKRFRVLLLATIVAAIAVPVGFALSLEPQTAVGYGSTSVAPASILMPTLVPDGSSSSLAASLPDVPDAVKLLLIGTTLFGLAAIVRKAS